MDFDADGSGLIEPPAAWWNHAMRSLSLRAQGNEATEQVQNLLAAFVHSIAMIQFNINIIRRVERYVRSFLGTNSHTLSEFTTVKEFMPLLSKLLRRKPEDLQGQLGDLLRPLKSQLLSLPGCLAQLLARFSRLNSCKGNVNTWCKPSVVVMICWQEV